MSLWNRTRLCHTEKEGGWWWGFSYCEMCIALVQQDKPTVRNTGSRTLALIQHSVFLQYRSDISNKGQIINASKQRRVFFHSRPKAVYNLGETFQILTDCSGSSSFVWKLLLKKKEKRAKYGVLCVRTGLPGFFQPFWEAEFPIYCLKERK